MIQDPHAEGARKITLASRGVDLSDQGGKRFILRTCGFLKDRPELGLEGKRRAVASNGQGAFQAFRSHWRRQPGPIMFSGRTILSYSSAVT